MARTLSVATTRLCPPLKILLCLTARSQPLLKVIGVMQKCTAKKIVDTVCEVEETVKGTSENAECSNRGNCDSQTGLCTCFAGYTGEDCCGRLCWSKKRREISLNNLDLLVKTVALHKERETSDIATTTDVGMMTARVSCHIVSKSKC